MTEVRHATADDVGLVLDLITALAGHHGQTEYVRTNESELLAAGFGSKPKFGVLLAEVDGVVAGFLSYTVCYSIWLGSSYMQIDDVFVLADFRGKGVGESLMNESGHCCTELGFSRIKWEVQPDNSAAIRFYERLGAKSYDKRLFTQSVG